MTKQIRKRAPARRPLPPVYELAAYSVLGFCLAHGLSRRKFYYMLRAGEAPRVMKCGSADPDLRRGRAALAASPRAHGRSITPAVRRSPHSHTSRATSRRQSRVRTRAPTLSAHGVTRLRDSWVSSPP